jgi:uncharacterized cupin superfamily protein
VLHQLGANLHTGRTVNIPANAPHFFINASQQTVWLLCVCASAGLEEFFLAVGVPVASRTTPPPQPDKTAEAEMKAKLTALFPKYRTEMLKP